VMIWKEASKFFFSLGGFDCGAEGSCDRCVAAIGH
jgi:hypothetical protein